MPFTSAGSFVELRQVVAVRFENDVHHSLGFGLRAHCLAGHERLYGQFAVGLERGLDGQFLRADDTLQKKSMFG